MSLIDVAKKAVEKAEGLGASQAEASTFLVDSSLTRYTKNAIHQNVSSKTYYLNLEVVVGGNKLGSTGIKSFEESSVDQAVERALSIASVSSPDPDFRSYANPKPIQPLPEAYCKRTAEVSPEDRAESVKTIIETALDFDKHVNWSAGSYSNDIVNWAVANSLGVEAEASYTRAFVDVTTRADDGGGEGSGYCIKRSHDVGDFNFQELAMSAAKDAVDSMKPETIPIGYYEAIFKPEAVSTFTRFLGFLGFSAKAYQDGYSFLTDKIGSPLFDEKLTITDMGRSIDTFNVSPFDGDGLPKGDLRLVNGGVAENLCYDNYTALKDGTESTGHAMPKYGRGFYRGMPLPMNQYVEPGEATVEDMIEETERGVYITRLHYVNPIRRDKAVISGLTRDACWYIEDGEVKHPIKVMRFTDSVLRVLGEIDSLGGLSTVEKTASATTPAIKVAKFRFTGQSEF